jgi:hypothetical protein
MSSLWASIKDALTPSSSAPPSSTTQALPDAMLEGHKARLLTAAGELAALRASLRRHAAHVVAMAGDGALLANEIAAFYAPCKERQASTRAHSELQHSINATAISLFEESFTSDIDSLLERWTAKVDKLLKNAAKWVVRTNEIV